MSHLVVERRRAPRVQPTHPPQAAVGVMLPVRVLDISSTGALLESQAELLAGDLAKLNVNVAGRSVSVGVEVRHVSLDTNRRMGATYKAGAVFVSPSAEARSAIEALLGVGPA
jgi:hypothetical protein